MKLLKLLVVLSMLLTLTTGVIGADQEAAEALENDPSGRFEIYTYDFVRNGVDTEVFIKMDRFTGQAWTIDGSKGVQWKAIAELKEKPVPAETVRYDLYLHDFWKGDEAQEVWLRFDRLTGKTWRWSGNQPGWEVVEQE